MSIEIKPFCHESEVTVAGGQILRLTLNFRCIDQLEALVGKGMDEILGELVTSTSLTTKLLWALTREHHPELGFDQLAALQFSAESGQALAASVGDLVKRGFNFAYDGDAPAVEGEQRSRPRRTKAKRSTGASRASSRNIARRG